jgi:hypothetical protein
MDEAIQKLKRGDWNGGLRALNALWVQTRCPELAAQIERLSRYVLSSQPPLEETGKALQKAWEHRSVEGSLVGLERLLDVILDGKVADVRGRLNRLLEQAPDPRTTMIVPNFTKELHLAEGRSRPVWTAFFRLVVHTGDPRAREHLEHLLSLAQAVVGKEGLVCDPDDYLTLEEYLVRQIPKMLKKLPAAGSYDCAELTAEVDALVASPVREIGTAGSADDLYAQVLEDPGDIETIRVWADTLLEAGDDRGTFVVLQLTAEGRPLSTKERIRETKLLKSNRLSWLGQAGLSIDPTSATFRRGLLDSAILHDSVAPKDLDAAELRSVAQLWAHSPKLLGHKNLVTLSRLGCNAIPHPHAVSGPVGFNYFDRSSCFSWEETMVLAQLELSGITHLETELPKDLKKVPNNLRAFPDLNTVYLEGSCDDLRLFEPLLKWLTKKNFSEVILNTTRFQQINDAFFVERLPKSNVHIVPGAALYRSYVRRNGELHAVLTDTRTSRGGFTAGWNHDLRDRDHLQSLQQAADDELSFLTHLPAVASLSFRQQSTWQPFDVEAVAKRTAHLSNVTLPKAKKPRDH